MNNRSLRTAPIRIPLVSAIALVASLLGHQPSSQMIDHEKRYGTVYHVGKEVTPPETIKYVSPEYPRSSANVAAPFGATVELGVIVDASGNPHDVHVLRSFRPDFDAEAVKAVQQYRFKPGERSGQPVAVWLRIKVVFTKNYAQPREKTW